MLDEKEEQVLYDAGILMTFSGVILLNVFFSGIPWEDVMKSLANFLAAISLGVFNFFGYNIGHKFLGSQKMHLVMSLSWFGLAIFLLVKMLAFGI